jgi:hypothetical protein
VFMEMIEDCDLIEFVILILINIGGSTYITSINQNKSQIIKTYCAINIITITSIKIVEFIFCNIKFISIIILTMLYIAKVYGKYEFFCVDINHLMFVVVL